jgi:hypothetical protein
MPGRSQLARNGARLAAIVSLIVVAGLVTAAAATAAPPANDDLADAVVLSGASGSSSGTDVEATFETDEQSGLTETEFGTQTSGDVWFSWTAPSTGFVAFRTTNPGDNVNLDTVLAAHTGNDITALTTVVVDDDDGEGFMSRIVFNATAGTTYAIGVGAFLTDPVSFTQGPFGLDWGASSLYDQDVPELTVESVTRLKRAFDVTFSSQDDTADIVGSSWLTVECQIDAGSFETCSSPWHPSVPGGQHTFTIRVTDGAGNIATASGTVKVKGSPHS